jgi:hypothetical protein
MRGRDRRASQRSLGERLGGNLGLSKSAVKEVVRRAAADSQQVRG